MMEGQNAAPNFYTKITDISSIEYTLEMFFVYRDKSIKKLSYIMILAKS